MALQEREVFKEITIKATEGGMVGALAVVVEIYDDVTGEIKSKSNHRQVVPLDDTSKSYSTPLGTKTVGELVSGINADIAAANSALAAEKAALITEKEALTAEKASLSAENQSLKGGNP